MVLILHHQVLMKMTISSVEKILSLIIIVIVHAEMVHMYTIIYVKYAEMTPHLLMQNAIQDQVQVVMSWVVVIQQLHLPPLRKMVINVILSVKVALY